MAVRSNRGTHETFRIHTYDRWDRIKLYHVKHLEDLKIEPVTLQTSVCHGLALEAAGLYWVRVEVGLGGVGVRVV